MRKQSNVQFFEEHGDDLIRVEKIRKEKRSERGRTTDDWLVDLNKKEGQALAHQALQRGAKWGRVIEVQKKHIFLAEENTAHEIETDLLWFCTMAKRHFQKSHRERNFVVVGDRVLFMPDPNLAVDDHGQPLEDLPRGVVEHAAKRTNSLTRKDPLHADWEHVLASNLDGLAIVASVLNPQVRWGLIDRFLVQAERENIPPTIILNKVDLLQTIATESFAEKYQKRVQIYKGLGYQVIEICALKPKKTPEALKELKAVFKGRLVAIAGHSGVGKSSVVNLLKPEFEQIVDEEPDIFYKGRHTTTYNSLLKLGIGGYAIDTPGIRAFEIDPTDTYRLSQCFPEFRGIACKYRACAHDVEEGCAIRKAVEDGQISEERYRSYLGILKGRSFRQGQRTVEEDPWLHEDSSWLAEWEGQEAE